MPLPPHHPPDVVADGQAGDFFRPRPRLPQIFVPESGPGRSFRQMIPIVQPRPFDAALIDQRLAIDGFVDAGWRQKPFPRFSQAAGDRVRERRHRALAQREPPAIGAMIWYSSASGSNGSRSSTWTPFTLRDTAQ